jgi:hypothetical protein
METETLTIAENKARERTKQEMVGARKRSARYLSARKEKCKRDRLTEHDRCRGRVQFALRFSGDLHRLIHWLSFNNTFCDWTARRGARDGFEFDDPNSRGLR